MKREVPSLLGIMSVENKLKHGTSIRNCAGRLSLDASPGEPRKTEAEAEAEGTSDQTNKWCYSQVRQASEKESNSSPKFDDGHDLLIMPH